MAPSFGLNLTTSALNSPKLKLICDAASNPLACCPSIHSWQLQKSPSRISGQNSANLLNISKVFFGTVIWKFESSKVSQAVRVSENFLL
jgi:hypothetical protein